MLTVSQLTSSYLTTRGDLKAVDRISFEIGEHEVFGLAGESACGKSTAALSIIRMLPYPGRIVSGEVRFHNEEMLGMKEATFRSKILWRRISMVPQASMSIFNPVYKIGDQITETIQFHEQLEYIEATSRVKRLFEMVSLDPATMNSYPHQLSGGMKQRAAIACAFACTPELVILDEPTTALDVIVQGKILETLHKLKRETQVSMLAISHDLSIMSSLSDSCAIMYAGKIVEYGDIHSLIRTPRHPYTKALLLSFPDISAPSRRAFSYIPGQPPDMVHPPSGCRYRMRCPYAERKCEEVEPEIEKVTDRSGVACHKWSDIS